MVNTYPCSARVFLLPASSYVNFTPPLTVLPLIAPRLIAMRFMLSYAYQRSVSSVFQALVCVYQLLEMRLKVAKVYVKGDDVYVTLSCDAAAEDWMRVRLPAAS